VSVELDRFTESHGLKKNYVVEQAGDTTALFLTLGVADHARRG
jgi:hypothetical protein